MDGYFGGHPPYIACNIVYICCPGVSSNIEICIMVLKTANYQCKILKIINTSNKEILITSYPETVHWFVSICLMNVPSKW